MGGFLPFTPKLLLEDILLIYFVIIEVEDLLLGSRSLVFLPASLSFDLDFDLLLLLFDTPLILVFTDNLDLSNLSILFVFDTL